jgi:hypothetical protein
MNAPKLSRYDAMKKWRVVQTEVAKSEALALEMLKHPATTPAQLVQLHAIVSKQATQMRETQTNLRKMYPDGYLVRF